MKLLLTGGAGAIGFHFIGHIMKNTDWQIVILDSFRHKGYRDRLNLISKDHPEWMDRIKEYKHDLVCPINQKLKEEIGDINYIIHMAAMSDVFWGQDNPVYILYNNYMSTITMCEYAKTIPHDAFIYFSTDEVYGPVKQGYAHKEWDTHRPSNFYSASKAASEDVCHAYWRNGDIKLIITNTMNNFGETQAPSKFPAMIQAKLEKEETVIVHGNEQQIGSRFYIHSRNAADAILYILRKFPPALHKTGEVDEPDRYHVVGARCLNNLELAQTIAKLMGKELKYELVDFHKDNPAHDIHYGLEDNKLRPSGWREPVEFEESMKRTIEWQQENKEWI